VNGKQVLRLGLLSLSLFVVLALVSPLATRARADSLATQKAHARAIAAEVAGLDARLNDAVAQYASATQRLSALKAEVLQNRHDIASARFELALAQQALSERAAALYKDGSVSLVDVVLQTSSFHDLLTKLDFIRRLGKGDAAVVDAVKERRSEVEARQQKLASALAEAQQLVGELAATKASIQTQLSERQQLLRNAQAGVARLVAQAREQAREQARVTSQSQPGQGGGSSGSSVHGSGSWWPAIRSAAASNGISADGLYRLMMIESGGSATASNGVNFGLFQYATGTWKGSWNPWRSSSIFDGGAQIRATALAIGQGHGPSWWPNTYPWAFGH